MDEEVTIRFATQADVKAIVLLWQELADMHAELDVDFQRRSDSDVQYSRIIMNKIAQPSQAAVLVVEEQGAIIGYTLLLTGPAVPLFQVTHYGEIVDFMITKSRRRHGLGKLLYDQAAAWFKKNNIDYVEVRASIFNQESNPFWRKMGFQPAMYIMNKKG